MYRIKGSNAENQPFLKEKEWNDMKESREGGWISSDGPFVKRLETEFAARVGREYGIAVRDGSTALNIAIASMGIGPGDEVILPTFTRISPVAAIVRNGAIPILVDSDPRTWNIDTSEIEAKITPKTKAIFAIHTYGLPVEMTPVLRLAKKYALRTIEDVSEMHGQTYQGKPCGSFGDIGTFSFYRDPLVSAREGGIIVTDHANLAERCRELRDLSFRPARRLFNEESSGNSRMNNLQAALGIAHLEKLAESIDRKREIGQRYTDLLADAPGLQLPVLGNDHAENSFRVYGLVLLDGVPFDAREMMKRLAERGIETRPFFWPVHEQPAFQRTCLSRDASFPVAENLCRRGFKIPSGIALKDGQIERVAMVIKQILSSSG